MTEPINKWIGARIRSVRNAHNKTQSDLAEVLGVTHATISDIELGKNKITVKDLSKIAKYLGMNVRDFIPEPSINVAINDGPPELIIGRTTGTKVGQRAIKQDLDLNNRIKEMVISYSRNDNIPYHPEAYINQVKQLICEVLDEVTPIRHPGTSEFADGANSILIEIALRRRKLEVDLTVASGQKL